MASFRSAGEGFPIPLIGGRASRVPCRPHGADINAGMLLQKVKTHASGLQLRAGHGRDRHPIGARLAQIFGRRGHGAVFLGQVAHHIIHRFKHALVVAWLPGGEGHQIIAGARLGLRIDRQQDLVAVGCHGIHLHINAIGLAPFGAKLAHNHIAIGHPMVPEAAAERAAGALGMDHGGGKNARRRYPGARAQQGTPFDFCHDSDPPCLFVVCCLPDRGPVNAWDRLGKDLRPLQPVSWRPKPPRAGAAAKTRLQTP